MTEGRSSLLPASITADEGDFIAGDPIELRDEEGRPVGRGLVNFDARETPG